MSIPMPGHPISIQEEESVLNDCRRLHDLIGSHDVVFLLTDTRESRWLPTIFSSTSDKVILSIHSILILCSVYKCFSSQSLKS